MKTPFSSELAELMRGDHGIHISIYLPRQRGEGRIQQDRILFKNLLEKARRLLFANGSSPVEVEGLFKPVQDLLADPQFWNKDANGLAVFVSPQRSQHYQLAFKPDALAVIAHHFNVLPWLAHEESKPTYYVLAISRRRVRLLEGSPTGLVDLKLQGLPENLEQALGYETAEKQRGTRPLPVSVGGGGRQAIYYGQGAGPDDSKEELVRYLRAIDTALHDHLKDERAPLVLAAVGYFLPLYREVNHYPYLVQAGIEGNPDKVRLDNLRARAWDIVQPLFKRAEADALARYRQLGGTGLAANDHEEILRAAFEGRVRELFVAPHAQVWGSFDPATGSVTVQPLADHDGEELLNLAAIYVLSNDGQVYFVEPDKMPAGEILAATYRY